MNVIETFKIPTIREESNFNDLYPYIKDEDKKEYEDVKMAFECENELRPEEYIGFTNRMRALLSKYGVE